MMTIDIEKEIRNNFEVGYDEELNEVITWADLSPQGKVNCLIRIIKNLSDELEKFYEDKEVIKW